MNDRLLRLKQKLLDEQLVEDSDYLIKYLALLQANLHTIPIKHVTQAHHALPVVYYKYLYPKETKTRSRGFYDRLANADSDNFLVNLKYSDHLLAHCYLALCSKQNWFKFANANMITVVSKHTDLESFASLDDLSDFQKAYSLSCELKQGKTLSEETKAKIAFAHRKENMSQEYSEKLSKAARGRVCSQESKVKISNSLKNNESFQANLRNRNKITPPAKGLVWITNGETITRVPATALPEYINKGYWLGRTSSLQIRKGYQEIIIHTRDWPLYEAQGWKKGWKLSEADRFKYVIKSK